jgi:hypothetical protein
MDPNARQGIRDVRLRAGRVDIERGRILQTMPEVDRQAQHHLSERGDLNAIPPDSVIVHRRSDGM